MKLHDIETEISSLGTRLEDWAAEHDGDVTEFPFISEMDALTIERERKLLSMACLVKEIDAEADALKKEAANLSERARVKSNAVTRIKGVISAYMEPGEKLSDERAALSWRKSDSVEVEVEAEALPERFRRTKITIDPDKTAIKDAIKAGEAVEGVRLVTKQNLQIK
jgi:uncharacterized coiled-coil DUF342 family protein